MGKYEDFDKLEEFIKRSDNPKKKKKSVSILKRISNHIKGGTRLTFLSEICGIIGLAFSIATFFYAQEISNQQNEMEKTSRENEMNKLTDRGSIYKLLIIKSNDEYKQSQYKDILDHIIYAEYLFYQNMALNDISELELNLIRTNKQINEAKEFLVKFQNFAKTEDKVKKEINKTLNLIKSSKVIHNSFFNNKIQLLYSSIMKKKEKLDSTEVEMKKILDSVLENINSTKSIVPINQIINKIKEDNYLNIRTSYYRESINFLDDTLNFLLLGCNQ